MRVGRALKHLVFRLLTETPEDKPVDVDIMTAVGTLAIRVRVPDIQLRELRPGTYWIADYHMKMEMGEFVNILVNCNSKGEVVSSFLSKANG